MLWATGVWVTLMQGGRGRGASEGDIRNTRAFQEEDPAVMLVKRNVGCAGDKAADRAGVREASRRRCGWRDIQGPDPDLHPKGSRELGKGLKDAACPEAYEPLPRHPHHPHRELARTQPGQPGQQMTDAEVAQLKLQFVQEAPLDLPVSHSHLQPRLES